MFRTTRYLAVSAFLAAAFAANAQTPSQQAAAGGNMAARGERHSFAFGGMRSPSNSSVPIGKESVQRPVARFGPVTPVPEPSEWAMLLVGLTFVGWIVRRKTKQ
jgi:hypothetical protein